MASIVKSVQRGVTTTATATAVVTLPETIDSTKTIFKFSVKNDRTSVYDFATRLNVDSNTQITFTRSGNTDTLYISWEYVQFDSQSEMTVQHGSVPMSSTAVQVTLGAAVNTTYSWIMSSWQRGNTGFSSSTYCMGYFINSGAGIEFDSAATMTQTLNYQVIQYFGCTVQAFSLNAISANSLTQTITSASTTQTALFTSSKADVSGQTFYDQHVYYIDLQNATTVRFRRYLNGGNAIDTYTFVVTFFDFTYVDQYTVTFTAADSSINTTITSRDTTLTVLHQSGSHSTMNGSADSATYNAGYSCHYQQLTSSTNVTTSITTAGVASIVILQVISFTNKPNWFLMQMRNQVYNTTNQLR